ncbi:MAG: transposase [Armatimonadetes bacterium]|nr:transposase [Armatimonadota bacterium]
MSADHLSPPAVESHSERRELESRKPGTGAVGRLPSEKARHFGEFLYQAGSWERPRRVVAKAEIIPGHERDTNRRFVVTNRTDHSAEDEYDYYVEPRLGRYGCGSSSSGLVSRRQLGM